MQVNIFSLLHPEEIWVGWLTSVSKNVHGTILFLVDVENKDENSFHGRCRSHQKCYSQVLRSNTASILYVKAKQLDSIQCSGGSPITTQDTKARVTRMKRIAFTPLEYRLDPKAGLDPNTPAFEPSKTK